MNGILMFVVALCSWTKVDGLFQVSVRNHLGLPSDFFKPSHMFGKRTISDVRSKSDFTNGGEDNYNGGTGYTNLESDYTNIIEDKKILRSDNYLRRGDITGYDYNYEDNDAIDQTVKELKFDPYRFLLRVFTREPNISLLRHIIFNDAISSDVTSFIDKSDVGIKQKLSPVLTEFPEMDQVRLNFDRSYTSDLSQMA